MAVVIIMGMALSILGFYINSELKEDDFAISKSSVVVYTMISFVVGILLCVEKIWATVLLLPYLIIQWHINKKECGEEGRDVAKKITWCEFCMGTGIGFASAFVLIAVIGMFFLNSRKK